MSKTTYSIDLVNSHSGFMGKYELDLIITTVGGTDFSHQVLVRDAVYRNVPFVRNFPSFRQARAFWLLMLDSEHTLIEVNDLYQLAKEFYAGEYSVGGAN